MKKIKFIISLIVFVTLGCLWMPVSQAITITDKSIGGIIEVLEPTANIGINASSPMVITGGVISDGSTAGTFKVSALTAVLRMTDSETADLAEVELAEQDDQAITVVDTSYYIHLNYNEGNPTISIATSASADERNIPIGKVMKNAADDVHFIAGGFHLNDSARKLHVRAKTLEGFQIASGMTIVYSGTNNFTSAEGTVYAGINLFSTIEYNSAVTTFTPVYSDGGAGWTYDTPRNTIQYDKYDDGDGTPGDVGNAKFGNHWVYEHIDDGDIFVVLGVGSYSLGEAQAADVPEHPANLEDFGILIAKIIAPQAGGSFAGVEMNTSNGFRGTAPSNHANLGNLDYASSGHTGFAASGANSDITSIAGLTTALTVPQGGTGGTTLTDHGILLGSGAGAVTSLGEAPNGYLIIGETGSDPSLAAITETGDAITISNGAASIDLAAHANVEGLADAKVDNNILFDDGVTVGNSDISGGILTLKEDTDDGEQVASFMAPALTASTVYVLPTDDGDADEVLSTDGAGILDWVVIDISKDTTPELGGDLGYNEKHQVFDTTLTSDDTASGDIITVTFGESVVFGEVCYPDATDNEWKKALGTNAAVTHPGMGIALETKGNAESGKILLRGTIRDDSAFAGAMGDIVYLSDATAGDILYAAPSDEGDIVQILGFVIADNYIYFNPDYTYVEVPAP